MRYFYLVVDRLEWLSSKASIRLVCFVGILMPIFAFLLELFVCKVMCKNKFAYRSVKKFVCKHGEIDESNQAKFARKVLSKFPTKQKRLFKEYLDSGQIYNASIMPIEVTKMTTKPIKVPKFVWAMGGLTMFGVQSLMMIGGYSWSYIVAVVLAIGVEVGILSILSKAICKAKILANARKGARLERLLSRFVVIGRNKVDACVDLTKLEQKLDSSSGTSSLNQLSSAVDSFVASCPSKAIAQIVEQGLSNCSFGAEPTAQEKQYFDDVMQRLKNFCV